MKTSELCPFTSGSQRIYLAAGRWLSVLLFGALTGAFPGSAWSQAPVITAQPQSQVVNPGATVTLAATATGAVPLRFQWRRNGQNLAGATNNTLQFVNAQPTNGGSYSVVVFNSLGAVNSQLAVLTVSSPSLGLADNLASRPVFNTATGVGSGSNVGATKEPGEPDHAEREGEHSVWLGWVAPGNGVVTFHTRGSSFDTLLAAYTGTSIVTLAPIIGNDDRGGALTSEIKFNATQGVQYLIAVDGRGEATGNIVLSWSFAAGPRDFPRIVYQPESEAVRPLDPVTFYVTVEGDVEYQWLFNGVVIPGETALGIFVSDVAAPKVGVYTVRITTGGRVTESDPAVLEIVNQSATPTADKFEDALESTAAGASLDGYGGRKFISPAAGAVGSQILNNFGSGGEPDEPNHGGALGGASRWQAIVPQSSGVLVVDTAGSVPDTVLGVYTGTNLRTLQRVVEDNNSGPDGRSALVRFFVTAGTRYLVAVDTVGGVAGLIQLNWRLGQLPGATQPAQRLFTPGENVVLSVTVSGGTGPFTYRWSKDGQSLAGATSTSLTLNNLQVAGAGLYTLTVSNAVGTVTSTIRLVAYGPVPVLLTQPQGVVRAQGSNLTLSASSAATLPVRYQWQYKGKPIKNATNASYIIPQSTTKNSGDYRVVAITTAGSVTSAVATVQILIPAAITGQPKSVVVANALKASFSVKAAGSKPLTYQWQFKGANIPGATNATHIIPVVQTANLGAYRAIVGNALGTVTSSNAELAGLAIKTQPQPLTVASGKKATFKVKMTGPVPLRFQWRRNGVALAGATNATYVIAVVQAASAGGYSVQVSNSLASVISSNAQLTVTAVALAQAAGLESSSAPPARLTLAPLNDGTMQVMLHGAAGATYRLEVTADFLGWEFVTDLVTDADGRAVYRDVSVGAGRFYRAVSE